MCTATLWTHCGLERRVMRFPAFSWFQQKIWLKCKILTPQTCPCAANWRKNSHLKNSHEKIWPVFGRPPRVWNILAHPETGLKKFFCPKTTSHQIYSLLKMVTLDENWQRSWGGFDPFWPPLPKPLAAGAPTLGGPKYLWGGHKSPPKHFPQPSPGGSVA